jgi:hypothetical protein
MKKTVAPWMALVFALGCSNERISGNSSETENTLAARTFSVDSLLPIWNHPRNRPTIATIRLDSTNFDFSEVDSAGDEVAVQKMDSTPIPFEKVYWNKAASLGRIEVRIDTALLKTNSKFQLVWKQKAAVRSNPTATWAAIPDSQKLALKSVLVDDFERGTLRNRLPDSAYWYAAASGSATFTGPTLASAGAGRAGSALKLVYSTKVAGEYSQLGTTLGTGGGTAKFYGLCSLDSLVVSVRGSGALSIAFDRLVGTKDMKAWSHYTLDSAWQRIQLRPENLDTADGVGGNVGWTKVCDGITNLSFLVSAGTQLWIDDVRLHGVNRDDLKR